jgi:hypothetical protein
MISMRLAPCVLASGLAADAAAVEETMCRIEMVCSDQPSTRR